MRFCVLLFVVAVTSRSVCAIGLVAFCHVLSTDLQATSFVRNTQQVLGFSAPVANVRCPQLLLLPRLIASGSTCSSAALAAVTAAASEPDITPPFLLRDEVLQKRSRLVLLPFDDLSIDEAIADRDAAAVHCAVASRLVVNCSCRFTLTRLYTPRSLARNAAAVNAA